MLQNYLYAMLFVVTIFLSANFTYAQVGIAVNPLSSSKTFKNKYGHINVPTIELEKPDIEKALREDAENPCSIRAGLGIAVNINMENTGEWLELDNGDRIWRLRITAPDAGAMFAYMNEFYLPKGAILHIYNDYKTIVKGGFTKANNRKSGTFSFGSIEDEAITLEYFEPKKRFRLKKRKFNINVVYYGYYPRSRSVPTWQLIEIN